MSRSEGAERDIKRRKQTGSDAPPKVRSIWVASVRITFGSCGDFELLSFEPLSNTEMLEMTLDCACLYRVGSQWS